MTDERLRSAIERAITGNELVLHYQPRVLGVRLALDDVTSEAQLDAASWIKWDYVKIGRAVVGSAAKSEDGERRLRMVVDATSALGVRIVAMGVEDDATLTMLRALGV